jgi:hypothetical protein
MTTSRDSNIHRHPDGSIDIGHYGSQAMQLRTKARAEALQRIGATVIRQLTKLPLGRSLPSKQTSPSH